MSKDDYLPVVQGVPRFFVRGADRRRYDRRQGIIPERLRRDSLERRSNLERRSWRVDRRQIKAIIQE